MEWLFNSSTQKKLIINGDVNLSHTDWNTLSSSNEYEKSFLEEVDALNFCSIRNFNFCRNIFLCTNLEKYNLAVETNSFSEHNLFVAEISVRLTKKEQKPLFQKLNINKADWNLLISFVLKSQLCQTGVPMTCFIVFYRSFYKACEKSMPHITKRRLDAPSYMSSHSVHLENKLKTLRKTNKRSEKIRKLEVELNLYLHKDKNFYRGFLYFNKQRCVQIFATAKSRTILTLANFPKSGKINTCVLITKMIAKRKLKITNQLQCSVQFL